MRSILAFVAVNGIFIAMNALAAALLFALFKAGQFVAPSLMEMPWVTYPIGIAALGCALWLSFKVLGIIERRPSYRARGRA